ncbi:MAG: DUF4173 domain-containing protein [Lachnospiraceae bacterium]|nr:DUF4173 domain-containing protein [Ruminococcus sp.]MCM1276552.1 DUF4173 domain-containing protein [Lachnospiraceae bacterium]
MEEIDRTQNMPIEQPKIPLADAVFAWASLALSFVFTHFAAGYFGGVWGGIFWALFGALGALFVKMKSVPVRAPHVVIFGIAELFCFVPLFSVNVFVNFLASAFSFILYLYLTVAVSGAELFGRHFVLDLLISLFVRPFENLARQPKSAFSVFRSKSHSKNALYALLGLVIAVPLTVVVVMLLISSDELFASSMQGFLHGISGFSFSTIWELLFAVPLAMYLFGAVFSVSKPAPARGTGAPSYRLLPPVISYVAVTPICVFYLIYIVTQFGNIASALGKTLDYSAFARRGFFELCAIAVINLGVIVVMQTFTKRHEYDKKPMILRVYTVVLSLFTLLIIATALTKMLMYIGEYGMTLLRVYTSWFMALLAAVFVLIIALQIRDYAVWRALFAAFTVMLALLCFGDFEGMIARYNISAYRSGALEELDVDAFRELGYSAAAPAAELLESSGDERLNKRLEDVLEDIRVTDEYQDGFAYFSIPRAKARAALERVGGLMR